MVQSLIKPVGNSSVEMTPIKIGLWMEVWENMSKLHVRSVGGNKDGYMWSLSIFMCDWIDV